MNLFILISLFIIGVSSQTNHGCKTNCNCSNIEFSIGGPTSYTKIDDCSFKLTCLNGKQAVLSLSWDGSEIEKPSDASTNRMDVIQEGTAPFPPVDFFSTFGIACEDGFWIATKYPLIRYQNMDHELVTKSFDNINGKKTQFGILQCF
ncbi:unnamed protein product [Caenorhabditis brenneri]